MSGAPAVGPESGDAADLQPSASPEQAARAADAAASDPSATTQSTPDSSGPSSGAPDAAADRAAELEAQLAALRAEHDNLNSQYVRLAADFDNFRKRQSRDNDDLRLQITCSTLGEILPVVDNFERARQQLNPQHEEAQSIHRSYQGLYKQLVEVFKQLGVAPMRVEGEPFDPTLHEAVMREESSTYAEDVIVEELQRGYQLNGRVIRHALVKVSMGPGPAGAAPGEAAAAPAPADAAASAVETTPDT